MLGPNTYPTTPNRTALVALPAAGRRPPAVRIENRRNGRNGSIQRGHHVTAHFALPVFISTARRTRAGLPATTV